MPDTIWKCQLLVEELSPLEHGFFFLKLPVFCQSPGGGINPHSATALVLSRVSVKN